MLPKFALVKKKLYAKELCYSPFIPRIYKSMALQRPTQLSSVEESKSKKVGFKERFIALKNLPKLFSLVWEISPAMVISTLILRLLRACIPVLFMYVGKLIIDEIIGIVNNQQTIATSLLWYYIALEAGISIIGEIIGRGISLLDALLGDKFANVTSVKLMNHAATLDLEQFEDSTIYDKLERARQQTLSRMELVSQTFTQAQDIITLAMLAAALMVFNPWLIVILAAALLPSFIGESHFNAQSYSLLYSWTPERRLLDYLRFTGASNETAKEVKVFGLSEFLTDEYRVRAEEFYEKNKRLSLRRASWGTLTNTIGMAGYYGAYILLVWQTISGSLTIGDLTFLAGSFSRMRGLMETIFGRFSSIAQSALYLQDLFDFFALQPHIISPVKAAPFPRPIAQGFVFENVGFRYHNSEKWALRNISFTLKPGEKLALVGENGAGKTTLVKLLSRLYDPTEGRILLDGVDLREYNTEQLRKEIGVIFQDFVKFQLTASDNIAVGNIEHRYDEPRIEYAAQKSLADSVIKKLPELYNQTLGKRFAKGIDLSGGEWQKIALARAYMRDAQVRILDEPTAALDARAEHDVFERFTGLMDGKTVVLISHRFSTVRMADRILVLENGMMKELGSHEELLEQGGHYAELFSLQAAGYK
jgi:ATP-binding cassette subfamily B protein